MLAIPVRECTPGTPYWNPVSAGIRTRERIMSFKTPQALIAYWNNRTVQARLKAMPEPYREKLGRYFDKQLDALNDAGPR